MKFDKSILKKVILFLLFFILVILTPSLFILKNFISFDNRDYKSEFIDPKATNNNTEIKGLDLGDIGVFSAWEKIEIDFTGPVFSGSDNDTNPFLIFVDVYFKSPGGETIVVPAFYNGDGTGNLNGNKWKVNFSTDKIGTWNFKIVSKEPLLNGIKGLFTVKSSSYCNALPKFDLPKFSCTGRLEYSGGHYLRFANGDYWIKGGINDPENFLGNAFGDWGEKKEAIDYLSDNGVNSIYVITNNIDGDRNDTWPWLGDTPEDAKRNSNWFNISKLNAWDNFFSYAQSKGIVLHLVLNDDSAWNQYNHGLYYREMVARFGYLPAIIWNIGEEANEIYSNQQQISLAEALQTLDPFNHPITVHRKANWPFFGDANFDITSIQINDGASDFTFSSLDNLYETVKDHKEKSVNSDHPVPIMIDETPRVTIVTQDMQFKMRSKVLYPIYLAGGNYEMHFYDIYGQGGKLSIQDMKPMLNDMLHARKFVEMLPFSEMQPCKDMLVNDSSNYCMMKSGAIYALYITPNDTISIDLTNIQGIFDLAWYNPQSGRITKSGTVFGGKVNTFSTSDNSDWALILMLKK
jgi:hypothetical protein